MGGGVLPILQEFLNREPDVFGYLLQQDGRNVSAGMERDCRSPTVGMTKLLVGTPLPDFDETKTLEDGDNFFRLEYRQGTHNYTTMTLCVPTNSVSNFGSPSSRSISMTSFRFRFSSSSVSAWEWAPGNPGT